MADCAAAMDWFTNEHSVLRATVESTATHGEARAAWELVLTMQLYQQRHGCWHDWAGTMRLALETARRTEDTGARPALSAASPALTISSATRRRPFDA